MSSRRSPGRAPLPGYTMMPAESMSVCNLDETPASQQEHPFTNSALYQEAMGNPFMISAGSAPLPADMHGHSYFGQDHASLRHSPRVSFSISNSHPLPLTSSLGSELWPNPSDQPAAQLMNTNSTAPCACPDCAPLCFDRSPTGFQLPAEHPLQHVEQTPVVAAILERPPEQEPGRPAAQPQQPRHAADL